MPGAGQLRLILMRHAKAGELPGGPDTDRVLTKRGHRDAAAAGQWLARSGLVPDAVACSPARRTRQTWDEVRAALGAPVPCQFDGRLYAARAAGVLEVIAETGPEVTTLLCVGHNPAMADLAGEAAGEPLEFPTSAITAAVLAGPWPDVAAAIPGDLAGYWTPKGGGAGPA